MVNIENLARRIDYDYTVISFFLLLLILENIVPRVKYKLNSKTQRENWIWLAINDFVLGSLMLYLIGIVISNISAFYNYIGIFNYNLTSVHPILQFFIYTLTFSLSTYTIHRLNHSIPILWKIHALHHSSTELTMKAAYRDHFVSILYVEVFSFMIVRTMLFSEVVANIADITLMCWILFTHANLNVRSKLLSKFLIMPHDHLWHHSTVCHRKRGQNYGSVFSIWDHLFNTYYSDETITETGVNHDYPDSMLKKILFPLSSQEVFKEPKDGGRK